MTRDAPKSFLWSLQGLVALVFMIIVLAISGALIGYNHVQLTRLTFSDAEEDFQRITTTIREEISGSLKVAGSVLDTASLTVDADLPLEDLAKVLTGVLGDLDDVLPAAMGIFVGRSDGTHVVVQSLDGTRPPEIGPGLPDAAYAFMIVENTDAGPTARWIVIDKDGRELRRVPPQPTTFDPRKRPWYAASLAKMGSILTPPYRFANVPEAGITLARQARRTPGAVFGIDMTLASLDQYLDKLRFPEELELLVFDSAGSLIAHPRGGSLRKIRQADLVDRLLTVDDLGSPLLSGMYRNFQAVGGSRPRSSSFVVDGESYFGRSERVGEGVDDLFISLAIPYDTMLKPAALIASKLLLVSGASVLVAMLIVLLASRRLALPLRRATEDIRRIMKFEFGHGRRPESRVMEVRELSRAIDTLELVLSNFMRYVPTALVRGIIGRRFSSDLGGIRQPITVLFSDVAGFTTMAESLDPEQVMAKTSRYFSEIGAELVRSGATIDKYIGDSVMAFWNAPEQHADHVALGCLGALRAARCLDRLNAAFVAEGGRPMPTRFGIHTGDAVVGNVGSVDRMNYTALGHTVNMASRFEALNKQYGTLILVSEDVRRAAGDSFLFRFVDRAIPQGAHMAIALYELIGAEREDEPELRPTSLHAQTLDQWAAAVAAYEAGEWEKAAGLLHGLVALDPTDRLFQVYLTRCESHLATSSVD
ncbi:adenylate/guanylate cyclase domain-containing protein [Microvirga antarctica]|uniref:adenylate/guanylate cyclase domain-containing protein n=1 Tax=Microvirga antarctica TaxID=2819233 RepID=UPI001B31360D|nr:adenylate/guanylate cyclase domain-containing protein [Microvirga antarctica]